MPSWAYVDENVLRKLGVDINSCVWVPFREVIASRYFLLNEYILPYLADVINVAALLRPFPKKLVDKEPMKFPYLEPRDVNPSENANSLKTSLIAVESKLSAIKPSMKERIRILKGKSDSQVSAKYSDLMVARHLLKDIVGVHKGIRAGRRIYVAYSFHRGRILDLSLGEEDKALELLMKKDKGARKAVQGIFKKLRLQDR